MNEKKQTQCHDLKLNNKGVSLLELVLTMILVSIALSVVLPVSKIYVVQNREEKIKKTLEEVRRAIDKYHDDYKKKNETLTARTAESGNSSNNNNDNGKDGKTDNGNDKTTEITLYSEYPESIDTLLENHYLRRLEMEPFGGSWQYKNQSHIWQDLVMTSDPTKNYLTYGISYKALTGDAIYDIRTSVEYTGLDGRSYNSW